MAKTIYKKDTQLILVFANFEYLNILMNWIYAINRLGIHNYLIISLDVKIFDLLNKKQINTILRPCQNQHESLWIHRINVIAEFIESGIDIIHSDADAVWLRDPMFYLNDLHHDFVFSQGTIWPHDIHKKWGLVLCFGFFMVRNTTSSIEFLTKLKHRVNIEKDDQASINRQLFDMGITWDIRNDSYYLEYKNQKFLCSEGIREGISDEVSVALLPHKYFQRMFESFDDVYVRHLISDKNSDNTRDILKQYNCWFTD